MAGTLDRHELQALIRQLGAEIPHLEYQAREAEKLAHERRSRARAMTVELGELQQLLKQAEEKDAS